ncbi:hypothetical protein [uncultured Microbacterium sp.]|uniref:hypothetical protein n=1 Tax=uncultured Microbacterium sp. TaxID=191216 RepID=UPI002633028F|nr:hypothetical protein [uncultured Microbacterium sp.]
MRLVNVPGAARTAPAVLASVPESGHYVLEIEGTVIGHVIEAPDGTFLSFDSAATPIAHHSTLLAAMERIVQSTAGLRLSPSTTGHGRLVAVFAGALLVSLLTAAESVLLP